VKRDQILHLLASLTVLVLGAALLADQIAQTELWVYLRGVSQLKHAPLFIFALTVIFFVLGLEWRGIANLFHVKEESLASVERNHPYLPHKEQIIVTCFLTIICSTMFSPVMFKSGALAAELIEEIISGDAENNETAFTGSGSNVIDTEPGSGSSAGSSVSSGSGDSLSASGSGSSASSDVRSGSGSSASGTGDVLSASGSSAASSDTGGVSIAPGANSSTESSVASASSSSVFVFEQGELTLEPEDGITTFQATDLPSFILVDVEFDASKDLEDDGSLTNQKALEEIVKSIVTDESIKTAVVQAAVAEQSFQIVQVVTTDSISVTTMRNVSGGYDRHLRTDILEAKVLEAVTEDTEAKTELADALRQNVAVESILSVGVTDEVKQAVADAVVNDAISSGDPFISTSSVQIDAAIQVAVDRAAPEFITTVGNQVVDQIIESDSTKALIADAVVENAAEPAIDTEATSEQSIISVSLIGPNGIMIKPNFHFVPGSVVLVIEPIARFTPGIYQLEVTITNPLTGEQTMRTQDFAWGVLAMNANQDRYQTGDLAQFSFGVLDDFGEMVCDARLTLEVTEPDGSVISLTTDDNSIVTSDTCTVKQVGLLDPDFEAFMRFVQTGTHHLTLTAQTPNGTRSISTEIEVVDAPPYMVTRTAATRLYPAGPSEMIITVEFLEKFSGTITDYVPDGFEIVSSDPAASVSSQVDDAGLALSWQGSWPAGSTVEFSYFYDAPDVSPQFYLVGPLSFDGPNTDDVTYELRSWQIANDGLSDSITGTLYRSDRVTKLASKTVAVSRNGGAASATAVTDAGGQFTLTGLTTTGGTIITLYIDGDAQRGVLVTLGSGSSMTGISLYADHLILRSDSGSVALTTNHLKIADNNADADITGIYSVNASDTLSVRSSSTIHVWAGDSFTLGGRVLGYSLTNSGTLTMGTNGLTLSGSLFTTSSTFTTSTGVTLSAVTPQTLSLGSNTLKSLTMNDGLVGYWKFDAGFGGSGATVRDSSHSHNHGAIYSAPTWSGSTLWTSQFYNNTSLNFDGTDDKISVPDSDILTPTGGKFTIAAWVRLASNAGLYTIASKRIAFASSDEYNLFYRSTGEPCGVGFVLRTGGNFTTSACYIITPTANTWYHVVGVSDGSSTRVYVNGIVGGTVGTYTSAPNGTSPLYFGALQNNSSFMNGHIDDVRIYNRNLAASEIRALAAGNPATGSGKLTLGSALTVNGNLVLNGSTLDVSSSNYAITLKGNLQNSGNFVKNSGTIHLTGTTNQTLSGSTIFHNLTKTISTAHSLFFDYTSRQSASGALTLRGLTANLLSLRSTRSGSSARVLLDADSGTQTIDYLNVKDSNATGGQQLVCYSGSEECVNSGNNTNWNLDDSRSITGRVYSNTGATTLLSSVSVAVSINGATAATTDTTDAGGEFVLTGINSATLTGGSIITLYVDGSSANKAVTVSHGSGGSMTGMTLIRDTLVIQSGTGGISLGSPITSADLTVADNNGDTDISSLFTFAASSQDLTVTIGKRLEIRQRGVLSLRGTLTSSFVHLSSLSGSLIQGSNAVSISTQYTQSGGTFMGGNSTIRMGAASSTTAQVVLEGGTFLSTSSTLSMGANYTHTGGGTFSHNNGTVLYDAAMVTWNVATAETFYNLTLDCAGTGSNCAGSELAVSAGDTLIVTNQLTLTDGLLGIGTIEAQGAVTIGSMFDGGTGLLSVTGNAARTISLAASNELPGVTLNAANVTVTGPSSGYVSIESNFTLQNGTFTAPAGILYVTGNYSHTGGTFSHNNGTVYLQETGSPTFVISGGGAFYNLSVDLGGTSANAVTSNYTISGGTPIVRNTLNIIDGLLNGTLIDVRGNLIYGSIADGGSVGIEMSGTGSQTIEYEGGTVTTGTITIAKPSGIATLSGSISFNTSGQDLTLTGGTLDLNGFNITVNDQFTVGTGTTLRLTGDETLTGGPDHIHQGAIMWYDAAGSTRRLKTFTGNNSKNYQNLVLGSTGSAIFQLPAAGLSMSGSLTISGGTLQVDGGQRLTLSGSWTRTNGTFTSGTGTVIFAKSSAKTLTETQAFNNLTFDGGTTTLAANLDVDGNVIMSEGATLDVSASNYSLALAGNFNNQGTFTKRSGTVNLNGNNQTLSGSTIFHNLAKTVSAARTLFLAHNGQQSVSGSLMLRGLSANLLSIRSTSNTNAARLIVDGDSSTQIIDYLDVKDSNAAGGQQLVCYSATEGCTNSGNNPNWKFVDALGTINGYAFSDINGNGQKSGSELTGLNGLTVAVSGTTATGAVFSANTTTAGTGAYAFANIPISNATGYTVTLNSSNTPTGYIRTRFNASGSNILGTGSTLVVNFGYVLPSTGSGKVFVDANDNGRRDAGENTGINGVTVTLLGTTATGGTLNRSTTSSSTGAYIFTWLAPSSGQYTFGVNTGTIPSGYSATGLTNTGIIISQGNSAVTANFGYYWYGTMSGSLFIDTNRNGIKDISETQGYNGATITLTGTTASGGSLNLSTPTTSTGAFTFQNVPYGVTAYTLTLAAPSGYEITTSAAFSRTVAIGQHAPSTAFGLFRSTAYGTLTARLWNDENGDGIFDGSETSRLSGVSVAITGTSATGAIINKTVTTGAAGTGTFVVPVSNTSGYTVTVNSHATPSGYLTTRFNASGSNLMGSGGTITVNFGYVLKSTISGTAFGDTDADTSSDAGETVRFSGAVLQLSGTTGTGGSISRSTTTNSSGAYSFGSLPTSATSFLLVITPPSGYTTTSTNSRSVTIGTGGQLKTANFGYIVSSSNDGNNNSSGGDGGSDTNVTGGSRRPYAPIVIKIDVPTKPTLDPINPVTPTTPYPTPVVPTQEEVRERVTQALEQKLREDRLLQQQPINFTLKAVQVPQTSEDKIDRVQDTILDGLAHMTSAVTAPAKATADRLEDMARIFGRGTEDAATLTRGTIAFVQNGMRSGTQTMIALFDAAGSVGNEGTAGIAQIASTIGSSAMSFITTHMAEPVGDSLLSIALFIDGTAHDAWTGITETTTRIASIDANAYGSGWSRLIMGNLVQPVVRTVAFVGSSFITGVGTVDDGVTAARNTVLAQAGRMAFASVDVIRQRIVVPVSMLTIGTESAIIATGKTVRTMAFTTVQSGLETTVTGMRDTGSALGQGIADTGRLASNGVQATSRAITVITSTVVRTASRGIATVAVSLDEKTVSDFATQFAPSIQTTPAIDPTTITQQQYKTSLYKKEDQIIIASLHLAVLSSFGDPYSKTPVVLFSDPKIAVTDEEGIATFHNVEIGAHKLEIHVPGEEVKTQDIILEPPSGLTLEEQENLDVVMPVIQVLVEKKNPWNLNPVIWFTMGLLLLGNIGWGYLMWHGRHKRDLELLQHVQLR